MEYQERLEVIRTMLDQGSFPELLEDIMAVCLERARADRGETNSYSPTGLYWHRCMRRLAEVLVQASGDRPL